MRDAFKQLGDWPTFPQLYAGGQLFGGLDVLEEMAEENELKNALVKQLRPYCHTGSADSHDNTLGFSDIQLDSIFSWGDEDAAKEEAEAVAAENGKKA
jgi:hypothetical protein